MKVFSAWSGGKDCMLALHRVIKQNEHEVAALLNMCDKDTDFSRSHGLKKELLQAQADAMGIRLVQKGTTRSDYEKDFKQAIAGFKEEGVEAGVFGDIYLMEHRVWIDRVCNEMGIEAMYPLWEEPTLSLATELVNEGFEPLVVSVHAEHLSKDFLGRIFDHQFISDLQKLDGIDICAENGEFHSFVINGPSFNYPLSVKKGQVYFNDKHWFLELNSR